MKYCRDEIWCRKKNNLDKEGPKAEDLLHKMKDNGIMYNILMINDKLVTMGEIFKNMYGGEMIKTFEMKDGLNFSTITNSVVDQIQKSVAEQYNSEEK